jgi:hypothetical protein
VPCSSYTLIVLGFLFFFTFFFFISVHLTMAGLADGDQHMPPQSPCTKGIMQALVREVKKHTEGLDNDVQMTNEKIGVLEATQLANDTKVGTMEASIAHIDTSLAALLRCFNDLMTREHYCSKGITTTTTTTLMNRLKTIGMSILLIQNLITMIPLPVVKWDDGLTMRRASRWQSPPAAQVLRD